MKYCASLSLRVFGVVVWDKKILKDTNETYKKFKCKLLNRLNDLSSV
jgi:hypothetical protein